MNQKKITFLIIILIILISILIFSVINSSKINGEVIENHYTYTKAICNQTNYCEDYKITCQNNNTLSINPTGATIQFPNNWKDPRNKELIKKIC